MMNSDDFFDSSIKQRSVSREKEAYFLLKLVTLLFVISIFL
jgi:hypothetical protein